MDCGNTFSYRVALTVLGIEYVDELSTSPQRLDDGFPGSSRT